MKRIFSSLPPIRWTLGWKAFTAILALIFLFLGATAWELLTPEYFECHHVPQPFTAAQSPKQAVFSARVVLKGILWPRDWKPLHEGYPRRYWALAVVQKGYWGLPWWDHKIVLLTLFTRGGDGFHRRDTYFVDGNRWSSHVSRFLPVFEIHCTRTSLLKYAEIDLRALRDGPPQNSVRIMGYTLWRTSPSTWGAAPGQKVGITGPSGEILATSDQQGIYDVTGLAPGSYYVHGTDVKAGPNWAHPICFLERLQSGDIRECEVTVP